MFKYIESQGKACQGKISYLREEIQMSKLIQAAFA